MSALLTEAVVNLQAENRLMRAHLNALTKILIMEGRISAEAVATLSDVIHTTVERHGFTNPERQEFERASIRRLNEELTSYLPQQKG